MWPDRMTTENEKAVGSSILSVATHGLTRILALLIVAAGLLVGPAVANAQVYRAVQTFAGHMAEGDLVYYTLPGLEQGQTLYVYLAGTSGDLDPLAGLVRPDINIEWLAADFRAEVEAAVAEGRDPFEAVSEIADEFFLAWSDDGGRGYDAAFEFAVLKDGDYRLLVSGTLARPTSGDYSLTVGVNAPEVLTGEAESTDDTVAVLDREHSRTGVAVQQITGTLTADKTSTFYVLNPLDKGDSLYVYIEATSGNLIPTVRLRDFGGKTLRSANLFGQQTSATLEYALEEDASNFSLLVASFGEAEQVTTGDFRLLVGVNAPQVLTGDAETTGAAVIEAPIDVKVGIKLQQISGIQQKEENYTAVAAFRMEWTDPQLAFSPDTCQCSFKTYSGERFNDFLAEAAGNWPDFTVFNQQGNRWAQNRLVLVFSDGYAVYFERFWTTLQAPDFDFRKFPFDTQQFYIRINMLFPEEMYVLSDLEGYTEVGTQLGEEEWHVIGYETIISSETSDSDLVTSRFSFRFDARRHLNYYVFRIMVPLAIIIAVSWVTFFLKDYVRRIEMAAANLLLFVAFNFTIAGELPRLGYLTLLDILLVAIFIVTALTIIVNVFLRRLDIQGRGELAQTIDRYAIWVYALAYLAAFVAVLLLYL